MRELSLHLMDIMENSVAAKANLINIEIEELPDEDKLIITVRDNGCGIDKNMLDNVKDPFTTSRKVRKVGLGLSLLEAACRRCDGDLIIKSELGEGTEVTAYMKYHHIDREPLGKVYDTIAAVLLNPDVDVIYKHNVGKREFLFDSSEIKKIAGGSFAEPEIFNWVKDYLKENLSEIGANLYE